MGLRRIDQRKQRQKQMWMSGGIALLMLASMFGIWATAQSQDPNSITEYGLKFKITQDPVDRLNVKLGGQDQSFFALPSEALSYPVQGTIAPVLSGAQSLAYSYSPDADQSNLAFLDVVRFDLAQRIPIPYMNAVSESYPSVAMPVFTCQNATASLPVIEFIVSDEPSIVVDASCIQVSGNTTDFLVARDRLLYEWYGVYGE